MTAQNTSASVQKYPQKDIKDPYWLNPDAYKGIWPCVMNLSPTNGLTD